jgi:hypothetical protein
MRKFCYLAAAALALFYATGAAAPQGQHPVLDAVANKVVQHYQTSSCEQLRQQQQAQQAGIAMMPAEQKLLEVLRTDPEMRHEFVSIAADQVVDKMIQCGMIH